MSDLDSLYREIVTKPHDNTLRLAYADALREGGDDEHADFIQLQIEHADCPESRKRAQSLWPSVGTRTVRAPAGWKVSKGGRKNLYVDLHYPEEWGWNYIRAYAANGFAESWESDQRTWDRLSAAIRAVNPVRELRLDRDQDLVYAGDGAFHFEGEPDRRYSLAQIEELRREHPSLSPGDDVGLLYLLRNPGLIVSERLLRLPGRADSHDYGFRLGQNGDYPPVLIWQVPARFRSLARVAECIEEEGFGTNLKISIGAWIADVPAKGFYMKDARVRHYPLGLTPQPA